MAIYSADEDLRKHFSDGDYAALPLPLAELHAEASRQIDEALLTQGYTFDDLEALTDASLASLRELSALRVLQLFFLRFADTQERAASYGRMYRDGLASVRIGTVEDAEEPADGGGRVWLA